jgi:hypothetical protein
VVSPLYLPYISPVSPHEQDADLEQEIQGDVGRSQGDVGRYGEQDADLEPYPYPYPSP